MNWHPIEDPPKKNGTYYLRRPMCAEHDLRSRDRFWNIGTYGYTTDSGWNTTVEFNGKTNADYAITPDPGWQWAYAEIIPEAQYRKLTGWPGGEL